MHRFSLIFISLFTFSFSAISYAATDDKPITQWTVNYTNPSTRLTEAITISLDDAENKPALIGFSYNVDGVQCNLLHIERFELDPQLPGLFKIQFKDYGHRYTGSKIKKGVSRELPKSLSFSLKDANPSVDIEYITDKDSTTGYGKGMAAKRKQIDFKDFTMHVSNISDRVFEPGRTEYLSYAEYSNDKKLKKTESKKKITRWTVEIREPHAPGLVAGTIEVSIFDAEGRGQDPKLIECYYNYNGMKYSFNKIKSFMRNPAKVDSFEIRFSNELLFIGDKISPVIKGLAPYIPESLIFNLYDKDPKVELQTLTDKNAVAVIVLAAKRQHYNLSEYPQMNGVDSYKVLELWADPKTAKSHSEYFNPDYTIKSKEVVKDKKIVTWTTEMPHPVSNKKMNIAISILDPDTNHPSLIKLLYTVESENDPKEINLSHVEEFVFTLGKDNKPQHFDIFFKKEISPSLKIHYYSDFEPLLPRRISIDRSSGQLNLRPMDTKNPDMVMVAKENLVAVEDFKPTVRSIAPIVGSAITETKSNEGPTITHWTAKVTAPDSDIAMGTIHLSVFDAENNPALIEYSYQIGSYEFSTADVKSFEIVHDKTGYFKIIFNKFRLFYLSNGDARPEWKSYLPISLSFNIKDKQPMLDLETPTDKSDKIKSVRTFTAKKTNVKPQDFKKIKTPYPNLVYQVLKPSETHKLSYDQFFAPQEIDLKAFYSDKAEAPKPVKQVEEKKRITRWSTEIQNKWGHLQGSIHISIFDAETNPTLIEMVYENDVSRDFADVKKFELIADKPGHFKIEFKERNSYYIGDKLTYDYKDRQFTVPKIISFGLKDEKLILETISDKDNPNKNIQELRTEQKKIAPSDFKQKGLNDSYKALEPSTIHPLSYRDFFGPKGVHFPNFNSTGRAASQQPTHNSEVTSADDLKLGSLLKDKKEQVWQLLQSTDKPTITEFLNAIGVKPKKEDTNPFKKYARNAHLIFELEYELPRVIAQFEKAFPGAIWYGLGRDIYLFADAIDAYYLFIGQTGRVKRLHASQPSFDEENPNEVIDFLKTNGFDFTGINKDSTPHIIFDVTSYSKNDPNDFKKNRFSQSAQLMRAAYLEWDRLGRDPHDLLSKVNFISVSAGANNYLIEPDFNIESFFRRMEFDPPAPKRILRVNGPRSLQYATSWHGIYERFQRTKDNKVIAPFKPIPHYDDKLAMLAELWDVAAVVMNDDFNKLIKEKMKIYKSKNSTKNCDETLEPDFD